MIYKLLFNLPNHLQLQRHIVAFQIYKNNHRLISWLRGKARLITHLILDIQIIMQVFLTGIRIRYWHSLEIWILEDRCELTTTCPATSNHQLPTPASKAETAQVSSHHRAFQPKPPTCRISSVPHLTSLAFHIWKKRVIWIKCWALIDIATILFKWNSFEIHY